MMAEVGGAVTAMAWDPTTGSAVVGTEHGAVLRLDRAGRSEEAGRHAGAVVSVVVDPAEGLLATADARGAIEVRGPDGSTTTVEMGSRVRSMAWNHDRQQLAAVSQAAGLVVLDRSGGRVMGLPPSRRLRTLTWHQGNAVAPLVVGGAGGATWIDPDAPEPVRRRDDAPGAVLAVAGDPVGPWIGFGDLRGEVRLLDGRDDGEVTVSGWPDAVEQMVWLPGRGEVVVVGGDEVTAWTARPLSQDEDEAAPPHRAIDAERITAVVAHPWRPVVAIGGEGGDGRPGHVAIWDLTLDDAGWDRQVPGGVTALAWDEHGDQLFVGTRCGVVAVAP